MPAPVDADGNGPMTEAEWQASHDPPRMLAGVCRYTMTDDVWARVEALKARAVGLGG